MRDLNRRFGLELVKASQSEQFELQMVRGPGAWEINTVKTSPGPVSLLSLFLVYTGCKVATPTTRTSAFPSIGSLEERYIYTQVQSEPSEWSATSLNLNGPVCLYTRQTVLEYVNTFDTGAVIDRFSSLTIRGGMQSYILHSSLVG